MSVPNYKQETKNCRDSNEELDDDILLVIYNPFVLVKCNGRLQANFS